MILLCQKRAAVGFRCSPCKFIGFVIQKSSHALLKVLLFVRGGIHEYYFRMLLYSILNDAKFIQ